MTQASVQPANTDNTDWRVSNRYLSGEVNQIDESGWLDQDTTLVTLSVGGNDVGFPDVVLGCLDLANSCIGGSFYLTRNLAYGLRVDPQPLTTYEPYLIGQLRWHLAATYKQIHVKAPNARVVVVGYPRAFGANNGQSCSGFSPPVQDWMTQMHDLLVPAIGGAVADTKAAYPAMNITFVDVTSAFLHHGVCADVGYEPWITGIDPSDNEYSIHPNHNGQVAYASTVNAAM